MRKGGGDKRMGVDWGVVKKCGSPLASSIYYLQKVCGIEREKYLGYFYNERQAWVSCEKLALEIYNLFRFVRFVMIGRFIRSELMLR